MDKIVGLQVDILLHNKKVTEQLFFNRLFIYLNILLNFGTHKGFFKIEFRKNLQVSIKILLTC